jgi:hypothetical protein
MAPRQASFSTAQWPNRPSEPGFREGASLVQRGEENGFDLTSRK